jgi:DNA-binding NarL/FixJ family response regulator
VAIALEPISTRPVAVPAIHVAIVDGARLVGEALAALLNTQADMEVVGNVDFAGISGLKAMAPCPDVAIVDFGGDADAASQAVQELRRAGCDTRVIILADRIVSFRVVLAAIQTEACAIVSGDEPAERLVRVVRLVFSGHTLIQPAMLASVMRDKRAREASLRRITRREMEVLRLLSTGIGSRQIATRLGMGYATVRTHMRNLAGKLSAHSKLEIVARAYELDLICVPDRMRVSVGS